ncbi:MAG: AAA family ATPase [Burkholderiales bacterium]|nr:AAA family ATPase [Burkholderiales bacterium]
MYRTHFGLREPPFGITPDTTFAFSARAHQAALNTLLIALGSGEGFIQITGEVGTGKTLLCRRVLTTMGDEHVTAYLPNPLLEPRSLMLALGEDFQIELDRGADEHQLLRTLNHALLDFARDDKRVVVLIDEAQAMPLATLEALRLLSNLETEKRKLLQVVLFGQPELEARLDDPSVRQIKQRITFQYRLTGLSRTELRHYLAHRLRVAGYVGPELFSAPAIWLLHRASRGIPRLVNIIAHKSLMLVFGEGGHQAHWRHVSAAVRDTPSTRRPRFASLRRSW